MHIHYTCILTKSTQTQCLSSVHIHVLNRQQDVEVGRGFMDFVHTLQGRRSLVFNLGCLFHMFTICSIYTVCPIRIIRCLKMLTAFNNCELRRKRILQLSPNLCEWKMHKSYWFQPECFKNRWFYFLLPYRLFLNDVFTLFIHVKLTFFNRTWQSILANGLRWKFMLKAIVLRLTVGKYLSFHVNLLNADAIQQSLISVMLE